MELSVHAAAKAEALPLALVVQSLNILAMDACSLEESIQNTLLENPLLEAAPGIDNQVKDYLFAQIRQVPSLYDGLHRQLGCLELPHKLYCAASLLIDCLDEDGWLREDLEQLAAQWETSLPLLEEALSVVQSLEPTGVGCRDLSECLTLQLKEQDPPDLLALEIAANHLQALADRTFPFDAYEHDALTAALMNIYSLSPRPCSGCGEDHTQYVVPDIRVQLDEDGTLQAELINQPGFPILSPLYQDYLKAGTDSERQYVRTQLDSARNYLHALQMRNQTLGQIAGFLILRQRDFFLSGPQALRAISLSQLAEQLAVNVSTVSRAVAGKYVEFAGRVFPLRDLFHSGGTGDLSQTAIVQRIHALLAEDPTLSDSRIAALLAEQGIQISRRTVNKYRHLDK